MCKYHSETSVNYIISYIPHPSTTETKLILSQHTTHSKIRDSFQSQCVSAVGQIPETIKKLESGILSQAK